MFRKKIKNAPQFIYCNLFGKTQKRRKKRREMKRRREENSQDSGSKPANAENLVKRNSMSELKPLREYL